ncbi:hypothetical protein QYE76_068330 [Lolium multiflorum]|uniref:Uncharacterized protein n=1 Tax=Lolium multiflorum TaxID=4521 RepID=A0AAD8WCI6_LOLMU|nr:hypothetical protein QYE76_068330 [Lolium multiflorum]
MVRNLALLGTIHVLMSLLSMGLLPCLICARCIFILQPAAKPIGEISPKEIRNLSLSISLYYVFYGHVLCRSSTCALQLFVFMPNGEKGRAVCHDWRQWLGWIATCEGEAPQQCHSTQRPSMATAAAPQFE